PLGGSAWESEYGDPQIEEDRKFLSKYSPYHNVSSNQAYPVPMFTTSTNDDRVHPAHARKMAARMIELGHEVFFLENTEGGHKGSANLVQAAESKALEFTYLWNQLSKKENSK